MFGDLAYAEARHLEQQQQDLKYRATYGIEKMSKRKPIKEK